MTVEQIIVSSVLLCSLVMFIWNRWRYDLVALMALLVVGLTGIVPADQVFAGFGHPAVITVAAIFILSHALGNSGVLDVVAKRLSTINDQPIKQTAALCAMVAISSAFMNNIGALALFMPIALQLSQRSGLPPSRLLMPLSFSSLLGGLITLIGTPPNIIIAAYREQASGEAFGMFDFAPVGLGVAIVGVLFITLVGWRLLPEKRKSVQAQSQLIGLEDYITEASLPEGHSLAGRSLYQLEKHGEGEVSILALMRGGRRILAPTPFEQIHEGDVFVLEGHDSALKNMVDSAGMVISSAPAINPEDLSSDRVGMFEAVISPRSMLEGRSANAIRLHEKYGINLLAIARQGQSIRQRIRSTILQTGDVLMLQGETESMPEILAELGCLPLAERKIRLGKPRRVMPALLIFIAAIVATALFGLPSHLAFTAAVAALVISSQVSLRESYAAIEGPVIVLLAAMIPVGQALENTGVTTLIAEGLTQGTNDMPTWVIIAALMVTSMALSDVINNAATAVIMAPIAASVALSLGHNIDPFLMAVAVGSSSTFLTPIGHQSNLLVMGPGGYRFGDYWRMGLPLDALVLLTAVPLILLFWPM